MQQTDTTRAQINFIRGYGTVLFLYVFVRAILLAITYDEAWSIETYVSGSFLNIISYEPCDSNNHLLNSLLIKLLYTFLPNSLFVARIPSLLAFIGFLWAARKVAVNYSSHNAALVFFVVVSNPFLLDFFSLARGYSLAMCGLMFAFYYLQLYLNSGHIKAASKSFAAAGISSLAILSFLNFFVALVLFVFWRQYKLKRLLSSLSFTLLVWPLLLPLVLAYPLYKLTRFGNLFYGGTNNVYSDSFESLVRYSSYHMFDQTYTGTIAATIVLVLFASFFVRVMHFENKVSQVWPAAILLLAVLLNIIQVKFLKGFYLIDRTALFYYPLLVLLPISTLKYRRAYIALPAWSIALLLAINLISAANFKNTLVWFFDADTPHILQQLNERGEKNNEVLSLGCSWPLHKGMEYYLKRGKYPFLKQDWNPNYVLYLDAELDRIDYYPKQEEILKLRIDTLFRFETSKVLVFKKK